MVSCVCKLKRESNFSSFEDNNSVFSVLSGPQNEVLPCCCGIHLLMDLLSMIALRWKTEGQKSFPGPDTLPSCILSSSGRCSFSFWVNPALSWINNGVFLCWSASLEWMAMWVLPAGSPALSTLTWHTYTVSWLPETPAHLLGWHCARFPAQWPFSVRHCCQIAAGSDGQLT